MAGSNESDLVVAGSLRRVWRNAGVPTNGTAGTYYGVADPGDLLINTTNMQLYINTNTQASPTWSLVSASGSITNVLADTYLTTGQAGIITAGADNIYLYLPTYVNHEGLHYLVKVTAAFTGGVYVTVRSGDGKIDGYSAKHSSAQYDLLELLCHSQGWYVIGQKGTWVSET
uniref:Uncharacterized protein n=1 Tax=viral metagenome TaxID=1070528 RepID=A0A6M3INL2_9ZZZZ